MRTTHASRQGGFSLIEVLIVVAIAAVAIAFIAPRITKGFAGSQANDEVQNVQSVLGVLRELKGQNGYGASANLVPALHSKDALPGAWTVTGSPPTEVTNPWGGAVTIAATASGAAVVITSAAVPAAACNTLVARMLSAGSIRTTTVGGNAVASGATPTQIATACGAGEDVRTIVWTTAS